jgi:hypothetical protein
MLILRIVQEVNRQLLDDGSNISSAVPQNHCHCCQISLQQWLQNVLNDSVRPKGEKGFEAPHAARFSGRQYDTYNAHDTA